MPTVTSWFLMFCLLAIPKSLMAQIETGFDHISGSQGLSQNGILDICQDRRGYLWFATYDGLNRYNGYSFEVFRPKKNDNQTITGTTIRSISEAPDGSLWIGTSDGLSRFNQSTKTFTNYRHVPTDASSLANDFILSVLADREGRIWVVSEAGLDVITLNLNNNQPKIRHVIALPQKRGGKWADRIHALWEDTDGSILIGKGNHGLYKIQENQRNATFALHYIGLNGFLVKTLARDKSNNLLAGTDKGLFTSYISTSSTQKDIPFTRVLNENVTTICVAPSGDVWAGHTNGLSVLKQTTGQLTLQQTELYTSNVLDPNSLRTNMINSLLIDKTNVLWVGTLGCGISKIDLNRKKFYHIRRNAQQGSLSHNNVRVIFEDSNGTTWMGTYGGGLNYLSKETNTGTYASFRHIPQIETPVSIAEVHIHGRKYIHVGMSHKEGIYEIDITQKQTTYQAHYNKKLPSVIYAIMQDSQGQIWYGAHSEGVYKRITTGQDTVFHYTANSSSHLPINTIRKVFQDRRGNLWIGTTNGLCYLPFAQLGNPSPQFITYQSEPNNLTSLPHDHILPIFEDSKGRLWIGTYGGGLCQYLGNGQFKSYTTENGLPNNVIKAILEDKTGNLWISTNGGLASFKPEHGLFKTYNAYDGLQANEFQDLAYLQRSDGYMLFGGINGVSLFHPSQIQENRILPRVVLSKFWVWNKIVNPGDVFYGRVILPKDVSVTDDIQLKHWENSFSFEFDALHFNAPQKNQFSYRLLGYDKRWIYTTADKRYADFTNLSPGKYVFEVRAANNDGYWSANPTRIKITVAPPFWKTWYAYIFYMLLVGSLIYAYLKFSLVRANEKHRLAVENLEKKKTEEVYQMKMQFFTNISHEFRTPLSLITGPLHYLAQHDTKLRSDERQEQYTLMEKSSGFLMRLVTQLLDFRSLEQGKAVLEVLESDLVTFVREAANPFQFLAQKRHINLSIEAYPETIQTIFSPDAIEKIINNLLSNALKFTPEHGQIHIQLSLENDPAGLKNQQHNTAPLVRMKVTDNGPGIPDEKIQQIFEEFFKGQSGNVRNQQGAGIGLALSRSLAELHHGHLYVDQSNSVGATFIVDIPTDRATYANDHWLPATALADEPESLPMTWSASQTEEFEEQKEPFDVTPILPNLNKPLLLLVEDNADMRIFIRQGLSHEFTIIEAINGKDALDKLEEQMPVVIVSDIMMPVMDGFEFTQRLKSSKAFNHIPIVFLTAKADETSRIKALKTGADAYITKPFTIELLAAKLTNILTYRRRLQQHFRKELTIEPKDVEVTSADETFLNEAMTVIEAHIMDTEFNIDVMVKELGMSRSNLYLKFKDLTGLSTNEFIRSIRLKRAHKLLETTDLSVKEIMFIAGFNTASYFSKCFKNQYGILPSDYRQAAGYTRKPILTDN
ncbi:two-component regulator propeller domain-containing protein [Spirosoma daeguense]